MAKNPSFLLPLLCFLLFQFSSANLDQPLSLSSKLFPSGEAERLIRQLNLIPKDAQSVKEDSSMVGSGRIVEKRFEFPNLADLGDVPISDLGHHAGYYRLQHSYDARMFYFFFESRNSKKDPVVIWLTGGPGCSSELAVFYENGPFKIAKNLSLVWNDYGWDKASNLIFVDQPTGTGFSYSSDQRDLRHDEPGVSNDLYDFLQAFFAEHPQYANNDFFITGESYAGHYIPAFAARVHQGNKAKEGIHINLKGFAIGNGLTNPAIQYKAYTDYAVDMKLITESDSERINRMLPACELAIKICGTDGQTSCYAAYAVCNSMYSKVMALVGDKNYYDIRKKCEGDLCYDFSNMENFLQQKSVKDALGVGKIDFVSCSPSVHEAMMMDWMRNLEVGIPGLLEDGIKMLIYAGEYDLICNWLGNSRWVHAMEWSGQKDFVGAPTKSFVVNGAEAGQLKTHGPLSFLKVHDAGHMVPMDQPKAALEMLKRWTQGSLVEDPIESITDMYVKKIRITSNDTKNVEKRFKFPNVVGGSNTSVDEFGHHAGYYKIQHSNDARLFYFFFESRNSKDDPVVIWLTGGPGCGSELALFNENGPFKIAGNMSLLWNDYGWDKISNIIYVHQPTGTGFSYSSNNTDLRQNEEGVSNDLYDFLQAFFTEHPQYQKHDFYITGESYAGHYIPAFASRVNKGNKANEGIHINLKGFAIGNGLTNPAIQYKAYPDYALEMKLITESDHKSITADIPKCERTIAQCETKGGDDCQYSFAVCNGIFNSILKIAGNINVYDIIKQCHGRLCYYFSNMEKFLNEQLVRDALGVGNITFVSCSPDVYSAMEEDWMKNLEVGIPDLLKDGINSLIYAGEYDFICNWLGNSRWVDAMEWYDQKAFVDKPTIAFKVDGVEAGVLKSQGPLSFLKVQNAGHMVPMDQPKAALEMLKRWIQGTLAGDT